MSDEKKLTAEELKAWDQYAAAALGGIFRDWKQQDCTPSRLHAELPQPSQVFSKSIVEDDGDGLSWLVHVCTEVADQLVYARRERGQK